jgi:adenylate kinase
MVGKSVNVHPQVILVMGVTGVGKSTFIEYATGCKVGIGHGQSSCKFSSHQIMDKGGC